MNKLGIFSSAVVLPYLLVMSAEAAAESHEQYRDMQKQLSIMSDIIKSSVSDSSGHQRSKINSIQSTYLRGQGVVFTISAASNSRSWGNYNFNFTMPEMPEMPVAPIAPEVNEDFEHNYDININETVNQALESAAVGYERVIEVFEHSREKARELREEQRELTYELRDLEREKRDINYQISRASDDKKKAFKADLDKLQKEEEKLRATKRKLEQRSSKEVAKQKAQQAERTKERIDYYQGLTASLTETLCLYGNGLKALPKDEHVSVILKSAGDKSGRRYKDSILVFSKKDIANCSADEINATSLLKKGQAYQF